MLSFKKDTNWYLLFDQKFFFRFLFLYLFWENWCQKVFYHPKHKTIYLALFYHPPPPPTHTQSFSSSSHSIIIFLPIKITTHPQQSNTITNDVFVTTPKPNCQTKANLPKTKHNHLNKPKTKKKKKDHHCWETKRIKQPIVVAKMIHSLFVVVVERERERER